MRIDVDNEYLKLSKEYEIKFGEEFLGFVYEIEDSKRIMRECLRRGRPHDWSKDPNFDPEAEY